MLLQARFDPLEGTSPRSKLGGPPDTVTHGRQFGQRQRSLNRVGDSSVYRTVLLIPGAPAQPEVGARFPLNRVAHLPAPAPTQAIIGVTIVVPAWEVLDLLNRADFKEQRARREEIRKRS
jgi:hypothetical protein